VWQCQRVIFDESNQQLLAATSIFRGMSCLSQVTAVCLYVCIVSVGISVFLLASIPHLSPRRKHNKFREGSIHPLLKQYITELYITQVTPIYILTSLFI
jgi:hypothetical protein